MAIITFYPLIYQVWMSFTDFGPKNFRVNNPIAPTFVGLDNYIRVATSNLQIPNFEFPRLVLFNLWWAFSNVVVHVILGVLIAVLLNIKGLWFRGVYRALFILPVVLPSIIVATVWRNMFDTDAGAVNFFIQGIGTTLGFPADSGWMHLNWLRQPEDPDPVHPAAARLLRDDHARTPGWAGRSTRSSRPAPFRASRATSTRRPRWTARTRGRSSAR